MRVILLFLAILSNNLLIADPDLWCGDPQRLASRLCYQDTANSPINRTARSGTTYVYGMDRLYGIAGTTKTWYVADPLGSVRAATSDAGVVGAVAHYDPYGQVQSGNIGIFGFTGELQQGSSVYLRARWYNASNGSFGSRDPFAGYSETPYSLMPYQYGYANPVSNTDPSGEFGRPIDVSNTVKRAECLARGGSWDEQRRICRERSAPPPLNDIQRMPPPAPTAAPQAPSTDDILRNAVDDAVAGGLPRTRERGGINVGGIGVIVGGLVYSGLRCLDFLAQLTRASERVRPKEDEQSGCSKYAIPGSCAKDLANYQPGSYDPSGNGEIVGGTFSCYNCATNVAIQVQRANPSSIVSIVELRKRGLRDELFDRDGGIVSLNGTHEVVAIDNQCFIDQLSYKYFGLRAVTWAEYVTVWQYEEHQIIRSGKTRPPGSTRGK